MNAESNFIDSVSSQIKEESKDESATNFKQKRDEFQIEIRRKVRDDILNAKRRPNFQAENKIRIMIESGVLQNTPENLKLKDYVEKVLAKSFTMIDFPALVDAVKSYDRFQIHYGIIGIRKILSVDNPPIQSVIDADLVAKLIEFVQQSEEPQLQIESAWAVTNLLSGTSKQTKAIVQKGVIPVFSGLLQSSSPQLVEEAVWGLGNIAGDSAKLRDNVLKAGVVDSLIKLTKESKDENLIKQGIWTLSNLCSGKPLPKFELVYKTIPIFAETVKTKQDTETLIDASWALSHLSQGKKLHIQMIIDADVVPNLLNLVPDTPISLLLPCVRTIANICTGDEKQCDVVLRQPGFLEKLMRLLSHDKKSIKKEAAWMTANLLCGRIDQIQSLMDYAGLMKTLLIMCNDKDSELRTEAYCALSNITSNGTFEQVYRLIECDYIMLLANHLDMDEDEEILKANLEAIENILNFGAKHLNQRQENTFLTIFESFGGTQKIEKLQSHQSDEVHEKALEILETYYDLEDA